MNRVVSIAAVVLAALAAAWAQSRPSTAPGDADSRQISREKGDPRGAADERPQVAGGERIRRGEYLVTSVAMCEQCHTPRNEQGELLRLQLLQGAQIPVRSPWTAQQWAFRAPSLAGLPGGWSEADVVKLLMTGKDPNDRSPNPPMPPFRMNREDATAVAAYLKSLGQPTAGR